MLILATFTWQSHAKSQLGYRWWFDRRKPNYLYILCLECTLTYTKKASIWLYLPNSKILFRILEVALGRKFSNSFFFFLQNCIWNYDPGSWFVPSLSFSPTLVKMLQLFSRNLIINRYMLYFINRWKCWKLCYLLCLCSLIRDTMLFKLTVLHEVVVASFDTSTFIYRVQFKELGRV